MRPGIAIIFLIFLLSCTTDVYDSKPSRVVIIKADDLGNLTPKWKRFIQAVEDNKICASIGIISSRVTERESKEEIKNTAKITQANGEPVIEFWNHGYNHVGNQYRTEFSGKNKEYQAAHIKKSQAFFSDSLGLNCITFSSPFNRTSAETYQALDDFDEIKIIMTYRKSEIFERDKWKEITHKQGKMNLSKIRLDIQYESVFDVPLRKIKKDFDATPINGYMIVQIHPNAWDEDDFSTFQEMIDFLKKKDVTFMTPQQYYKYLQK